MKMWRRRANKEELIKRGPAYPFQMWVPRNRQPSPPHYDKRVNFTFSVIPIDSEWSVWMFKSKGDLDTFCLHLIALNSSVDDGNPHKRK